jgi:hypothetical protein
MSDADHLLRQREREHERDAAATSADAARRAATNLAALKRDVAAETTAVLKLLKKRGYPDMTGVTIERARLGLKYGGLGYKRERVAAWPIGEYTGTVHGDAYTGQIFLLSSGKFMLSGGRSSGGLRDLDDGFLQPHLPTALAGLRSLRERLERE